jgi:hypothetical protein
MTVRTEREQKVERLQKESEKKGGQNLEGLYVGEGFVLSTFSISGPHLPDFGTPTPPPNKLRWALKSRRY